MMKIFAVIDKAQDCLVALPSAQEKKDLLKRFPKSEFDLVDMTGKGGPPAVPGLMAQDVTVNKNTKEWKIKGKTVEERTAAAKDAEIMVLRHRIVDLEARKDRVASLGDAYAGVLEDLQTAIDSAKEEITELGG